MGKNVKDVLEEARYELVCLTDLWAFDKGYQDRAWRLDFRELIKKIDALILSVDKDTYS